MMKGRDGEGTKEKEDKEKKEDWGGFSLRIQKQILHKN